jgi:HD-like signal output (HDOD) protein
MTATSDLTARAEARGNESARAPGPGATAIQLDSGSSVDAAAIVAGLCDDLNCNRLELPGFPDVVVSIHRALADETTSARDVVRLVASEPVLAARLVQVANSAAFNKSGREVSDLKAAISSLGFTMVRSQATAFAMRQMQQLEWLRPIRPVLAEIWKASNGVAALSFAVARRVPGVQADEAMATGLFHLLGKLYLFARARQESIDPRAIADWEHALNEWHPTIARTILDHWRIPERVAEAVEQQNAIFDADLTDLSLLARILCGAKLHYRLRRPGAPPEPGAEAALARIRFDGQSFDDLAAAARAEADAVGAAIG